MTYRWVPLTEAVQLVLGGKVHNALAIQAVLATYAAAQNNFEDLRPAEGGWEFHPYMGQRREKPENFRNH